MEDDGADDEDAEEKAADVMKLKATCAHPTRTSR